MHNIWETNTKIPIMAPYLYHDVDTHNYRNMIKNNKSYNIHCPINSSELRNSNNMLRATVEIENTNHGQHIKLLPGYNYIETVELVFKNDAIIKPPFIAEARKDGDSFTYIIEPYLDNIKNNSLVYKLLYNNSCYFFFAFDVEKILITYMKYRNKYSTIIQHRNSVKYELFDTNQLRFCRQFSIMTNFKLIIPKKIYDHYFFSIIIISNGVTVYELQKKVIDILRCFHVIDKYIYINMVHLPSIYLDFLSSAQIDIRILYKKMRKLSRITSIRNDLTQIPLLGSVNEDAPPKSKWKITDDEIQYIKSFGNIYIYYNGFYHYVNTSRPYIDPRQLIYKTSHFDIKELRSFLRSDRVMDILCLTDLSDVFQYFCKISTKKYDEAASGCHHITVIPPDIWALVDSYLEKDMCYINIIADICENIKIKKSKNIILIHFNKLKYSDGILSLLG